VRVFRPVLDHLFAYRKAEWLGDKLPTLLIAAPGRGRVNAWWEFLEEVREARWDYPLPAYVAAWEDLPTDDERLLTRSKQLPSEKLRRTLRFEPLRPRRPSSPLSRPVGDALRPSGRPHAAICLEHVALDLTPSDRELLPLVGSHPFLPAKAMATVLGWTMSRVRKHRRRLIERGLMRPVGPDEIGKHAQLELGELTVAGMELLAAGQGLSLTRAIFYHGLTGGGPDEPIGARQALLANVAHTLGCDALFVGLYRVAEQLRECGTDDAVLEWQNGTACSRRHLRPDGYGRYYREGYIYDFYLEYDRATMSSQGYYHKFQAYYDYWNRLRLYRNQYRFPRVLVVTVSDSAEERIARVAHSAALGQYAPLPLLLTCQWRVDENVNRPGLLGPIWREVDAEADDRHYWIPPCLDRASEDRALAGPRPPAEWRSPA